MTPRQHETLEVIAEHQPIARRDIAQVLGIASATVGQHLHKLHKAGRIDFIGTGNAKRWTIADANSGPSSRARYAPVEAVQCPSVWEYANRCERLLPIIEQERLAA